MHKSTASDGELSREDLELLERARELRSEISIPEGSRERILARSLREASLAAGSHQAGSAPGAKRGAESIAVAAVQLVPVRHLALRPLLALGGALAFCVAVLGGARALLRAGAERAAAEPQAKQAAQARAAGEQLLQAPLFRAPAQTLEEAQLQAHGPNLLGEQPFSSASGAWQVRRWNDLSTEPTEAAAHGFEHGALCVALGAGERVLGGWPWVAPGAAPPKAVALAAGRAYRLSFKAWSREPLPAQLLIGVGHMRLPFSAAGGARVPVSGEPQPYAVDFVAPHDDAAVGVAFLATGTKGAEPTRVCLSDVALSER